MNAKTNTAATNAKANSETITKNDVGTVPAEVIQSAAPATISKADKARKVFAEAYPDGKTTKMQRKDIIAAMVKEAGLTPAGAATYLQNFKDKAGITVKKAAAPAAQAAEPAMA